MGMLFNTEQTRKMVARLNTHFAAKGPPGNGRIMKWRGKKKRALFDQDGGTAVDLVKIATDENVVVDPADDDDAGKVNAKWMTWLGEIYKAPCTRLSRFHPRTAVAPADPSVNTTVGKELSQQIWQGLDDAANCEEIMFTVVPSEKTIFIDEATKIPLANGNYTLLITIHTTEAADAKAAVRKMIKDRQAAAKAQDGAIKKKKKM
jgi:hypothetical protein